MGHSSFLSLLLLSEFHQDPSLLCEFMTVLCHCSRYCYYFDPKCRELKAALAQQEGTCCFLCVLYFALRGSRQWVQYLEMLRSLMGFYLPIICNSNNSRVIAIIITDIYLSFTTLSTLHAFTHFIFTKTLWGSFHYHHPPVTDEKSEAQTSEELLEVCKEERWAWNMTVELESLTAMPFWSMRACASWLTPRKSQWKAACSPPEPCSPRRNTKGSQVTANMPAPTFPCLFFWMAQSPPLQFDSGFSFPPSTLLQVVPVFWNLKDRHNLRTFQRRPCSLGKLVDMYRWGQIMFASPLRCIWILTPANQDLLHKNMEYFITIP